MKYFASQFKQFVISSALMGVAVLGVTISKSFDQQFMAEVSELQELETQMAKIEKEKEKDKKSDVVMK